MKVLALVFATVLLAWVPRQALKALSPRFWRRWGGWQARRRARAQTDARHLTASCRAAELGPVPEKAPLAALGRPLPDYMLRATAGDEDRALLRWAETLKWRCDIGDEDILKRPHPNYERIQPHYPQYLHLPDRAGRLTYWELVGRIDTTALAREGLTADDIFEHYIWSTLFTWDVAARDDKQEVTVIADLANFSISVISPTVASLFARVAEALRTHFPQREFGLFFINAPSWVALAYKALAPLVSEAQLRKVRVVQGREASQRLLRELIAPRNLPREYGGRGPPLGASPLERRKRRLAARGT